MLKDQEFIRNFYVSGSLLQRVLDAIDITYPTVTALFRWTIGLFLYLRFYLMALFWCPNKRRTSPGCSTVEINTWARLLEQHAYEVEFPIWTRIKLDPHLNRWREWKPSLPVYWVYKKKTLVQCSLLSLSVKRIRKTERLQKNTKEHSLKAEKNKNFLVLASLLVFTNFVQRWLNITTCCLSFQWFFIV